MYLNHDYQLANLPFETDCPGFQDNTAAIGFDPHSIACDPDNEIPGWEKEPPCCSNYLPAVIKSIRAPARSIH
jgi:hypothetical protein